MMLWPAMNQMGLLYLKISQKASEKELRKRIPASTHRTGLQIDFPAVGANLLHLELLGEIDCDLLADADAPKRPPALSKDMGKERFHAVCSIP